MKKSPLAELISHRVGAEFEFGGYQFSRAEGDEQKADAFRLRHRIFHDEGFLEGDSHQNGMLSDEFDPYSVQILVRDSAGALVGTTRFVHSSPIGFPTESLFDFTPPTVSRERLGEYGRLAILPEHRGGTRLPMLGMLKAVFECMLEQKVTHVYAFLSPRLAHSYSKLGCVSVPLETKPPSRATMLNRKPMRGYFQSQVVRPVLFDLHDMMLEVGVPIDRAELDFVKGENLR